MRPNGLWHPRLLEILTSAGHTDLLVICDAGLPIPPGVETVQLCWREGEPRLLPVLRQVLREFVVERAVIARELTDGDIRDGIHAALPEVDTDVVSHAEFKRRTASACAVVRTGEVTPYSNIILQAGVPYGPAAPSARAGRALAQLYVGLQDDR